MKYKKKFKGVLIGVLFLLGLIVGYQKYASPTKIATLNFPDFTVEKFVRSNNNSFVNIERVNLDEVDKIFNYDMVLVRVHGNTMDHTHLEAIRKAITKGISVYATESTQTQINSLKGKELKYIATLMENGSVKNYRSLFNYIRKRIDKKLFFNGSYGEPIRIPEDYFFSLGEDNFFSTYKAYQQFYEKSGHYKEGAPRLVLLSGNINIQNSNAEPTEALIHSFEKKGFNVYPINSFGAKKLELIKSVQPNIIVNHPHGRLVMGRGDEGLDLLKELNIPILAPLTVNTLYEKWLKDKQGLASGGMTSMSIVMPELDGQIAPMAITAQFARGARQLFDTIPRHADKFTQLVKNFSKLQTLSNKDKKIAIYYYKGVGKSSVSASGIEGVPSLYNTLKLLQASGYDVTGLPNNAKNLEKQIQQSGTVLGPYARGTYDEFIKHGNPALVEVDTFHEWAQKQLPSALIKAMEERYGKAPGAYMNVEKNNKKYIAVARLCFGNVVLLPQLLPAVGKDVNKLIHGTAGAPTYPYVASYLWTRNAFKADAIIHFGTHGSLEFIPGKQVGLSDYDWSDVLISDMPHFYIYTIGNIGEGIIAKRRTYATLLSHLTSPFMQSDLYGELNKLDQIVHRFSVMEESNLKQGYREHITKLAKGQNILSALSLDSMHILTDAEIKRVHIYLEEIEGEKVIDGLYTLGVPYSPTNVSNTARLMSIDPIRYALGSIDVAHGKVKVDQLKDITFINKHYLEKTESLIKKAVDGVDPNALFTQIVSGSDYKLWLESEKKTKLKQIRMQKMMAEAKPVAYTKKTKKENLLTALQTLYNSIVQVKKIRVSIAQSTKSEQEALLDALNGGYIEPSSAGDPIANPKAVPTGKNFYSINPEKTPSAEAWLVGKRLGDALIEAELASKGKYPEKVSFSLWSTSFMASEGSTVAEILYLLGVEPLRDGFGYIRSLRLIPAKELGRPRIDVVVQTSGQLRDIAASRLALINQAVALAATDEKGDNFVRKGFADAERRLLEKGFSPVDARKYSRERVFGGIGGRYGTGIMGMVEKGDSWDNRSQIAKQYIKNMGAMYSSNGSANWGEIKKGVFEAALLNTSVVVQPRSSNTWGALSLDHVYEFMGGMTAAVKEVTGHDPSGYFNDFRNTNQVKVQELKEAIGVEINSTVFNPKYIRQMLKGEASAMNTFAEVFRNTYGWNAMKPSAIDQHIWNTYYAIYVKDKYHQNMKKVFSEKNPYALQEMTAVMLESARKGMWKASAEQVKQVADLHTEMVHKYMAGCSGFICNNGKLRDFIATKLSVQQAKTYQRDIKAAREVKIEVDKRGKNVVLKKDQKQPVKRKTKTDVHQREKQALPFVLGAVMVLIAGWLIIRRFKH